MEVQPTLSHDRMGNAPSLPGLGGGRTHVKRDMAKDDQKAELRPENLSVSSSESELSEEEKDEQFDENSERNSLVELIGSREMK